MMLVIYGPTATGKTDLAINFAKKYNGELISADSRQIYKGLDIGSGKVGFKSKVKKHQGYWIVDGVKINGFDLASPGENFSVADFLKFAQTSLVRISKAKKLPIVVGGTGFYIKALIDGVDSIGIPADQKLRNRIEKLTVDQLYQKLLDLDSQRANSMNESDRLNPRRLIRAIEIAIYNKKQETRNLKPTILPSHYPAAHLLIGLTAPNNYLYDRADKWLETRLAKGMIDEVRDLVKSGIDPLWLGNLGLEYRWLSRFTLGKITKDQALSKLRGNIHSFIRRQKTWFNQFPDIHLFDITSPKYPVALEKIVELCFLQL